MAGEVSIFDLLAKWESAQHRGEPIALEELCAEAPELLPELRAKVSALNSIARMVETLDPHATAPSHGSDGFTVNAARKRWDETPIATQSRYEFVKWHAKGGLGEVLIARDAAFGRDVAIKVIKAPYEEDERCRRRFLKEAEITGRLEHPGVAPVYSLGVGDQGHPCYAMRFIDGQTLADAALELHQALRTRARREVDFELRKLLARFVSVCNTIAYAHSRDIVHRDLKPANILLGSYGETFVIDWGLAKVLRTSAEGDEGGATLSDDGPISGLDAPQDAQGPALTQHNDIVGTPVYMSPEQALPGEPVGKPADIYGLGATLYFLLTGEPPVQDVSLGKVIEKVRQGRIARPRTRSALPDAKLEAICMKALAKEPQDRYPSANDLADDLEHWLADEPVSAAADSLAERAARLARRHRGVALASVAGVLVVAVVSSVFAVLLNWQTQIAKTQKAAAESLATQNALIAQKETRANQRAQQLAQEKTQLAQKESQARQRADEQSQLALTTLKTVVRDIQRDLAGVSGAAEIRRGLLQTALAGLDRVAKSIELQPEIDRNKMIALNDVGGIYLIAGSVTGDDAPREALRLFTIAKELAEKLAGGGGGYEAQRDLSVTLEKIGEAHLQLGDLAQAEAAFRESLAVSERSAASAPDPAGAARDLAFGFEKVGDLCLTRNEVDAARAAFDRSRELFLSALAKHPSDALLQRDLAVSLSKLGNIRLQQKDYPGAAEAYAESVSQLRSLIGAPKSPASKRDLSVGLNKLGAARQQEQDYESAAKAFSESLQWAREHLAEEPNNLMRQRDVTVTLNNLGDLALARGDFEAAQAHFEESYAARQRILSQSAGSFAAQIDAAYVLLRMADLAQRRQDDAGRKSRLTEAQAILRPLHEAGKLQSAAAKEMYDTVEAGLKE